MIPPPSVSAEDLLAHAGFLAHLAGELVGDEHRARDLVQEAYVTALERPPRDRSSLRGWLAIVTSNLARNARRGEERRGRREGVAARPEVQPVGDLPLERLELQRVLIGLVTGLAEEARTVVYLRYYEGLGPAEIASRLGVPVKTVKTRHTRALAELRARLDARSGGDRSVWVGAFLPWLRPPTGGTTRGGGMAVGTKLVLGGLLVGLLGWSLWRVVRAEPELAPSVALASPDSRPASEGSATTGERRELAPATSEPVAEFGLAGRVRLHEDGSPLVGVEVAIGLRESGSYRTERARTDEQGGYRVSWAVPVTVVLVAVAPTATTTGAERALWRRTSPAETLEGDLWVTVGASLAGRVVDPEGHAVPGAEVQAWCGAWHAPGSAPDRRVHADRDGAFRIEHLGPEFALEATAEGFACVKGLGGRLPAGGRGEGLEVVLGEACTWQGRVVDPAGRPLEGASIFVGGYGGTSSNDGTAVDGVRILRMGDTTTRSDADGRFTLGPLPRRVTVATVSAPDHLPRVIELEPGVPVREVVLQPGLRIAGRVLDAAGLPLEGARVSVPDARGVTTDAEGRFEALATAETEDGIVSVVHLDHAVLVRQPVAIGPGTPFLELRLERAHVLAGRVVDRTGAPQADVEVHVEGERLVRYENTDFGETTTWEWKHGLQKTRTDDEGRFRLGSLYPGEFRMTVRGLGDAGLVWQGTVRAGNEALEIVADPTRFEGLVFSGRVVDALTREPVPFFRVSPMREVGPGTSSGRATGFGPEAVGRFRLSGNEGGAYRLDIAASGYVTWHGPRVERREGEVRHEVVLFPRRSAELDLRDADGQVVRSSVRVYAFDGAGDPFALESVEGFTSTPMRLGPDSRTLVGLPAGTVRLRIESDAYLDRDVELDLTLPVTAPFPVVLEDDAGSRRARLQVLVFTTDDPEIARLVARLSERRELDETGKALLAACREERALPPEEEVELVLLDGAGQRVGWGAIRPANGGFLGSSTSLTSKDGSTWSESEDPNPNVEPSIRFDVPVRARTLELSLGGRAVRRIEIVPGLAPDELEVLVCALLRDR